MKPDIVVLTYFINDGEPMPTYPKESWLDLHSAAWIVLNYRLDSLIRQFGPRPDWKQYYRELYSDNARRLEGDAEGDRGVRRDRRTTGIKIVVFHLPELRELKPYPFQDVTDKVKKVVEANGMRFVDLLPTVENMDPASLWVTVPDPHPNAKADTAFTDGMIKRAAADARRALPHREEGLLIITCLAFEAFRLQPPDRFPGLLSHPTLQHPGLSRSSQVWASPFGRRLANRSGQTSSLSYGRLLLLLLLPTPPRGDAVTVEYRPRGHA